ncbi:MAG TPA: aldehyde ferredoxin oxidoreductase C-terminal domain-containing protein, partial [Dehalococcoidia bacterium]|nr:aldehyde ferredoxin oxidoreductase C-terminal domain-containing protein [Dehalococcoidia bacterium]
LDRLCDEIGVDTIEAGAAIAVLMDAGQMEWGNVSGMKKLLEEVANGTDMGTTIGNGAETVGKRFNHARVPIVKGQAVPAWDPRPLKATGVTYGSSAMGADHTAGLIVNPGLPPDQFAVASQEAQMVNAVCDSSGFCMFLQPSLDNVRAFYGHMVGSEVSREQIAEIGWECLSNEWEFSKRAGLTEADDDLPACLREEGVGPGGIMKFDVPKDVIQQAKVRGGEWREQLFTQKPGG